MANNRGKNVLEKKYYRGGNRELTKRKQGHRLGLQMGCQISILTKWNANLFWVNNKIAED